MKGMIAKKLGMTSIFDQQGTQIPCTILQADPCQVTQIKTIESDGYQAFQLSSTPKKEKHTNKSEQGHFAKSGVAPQRYVKEFRDFSLDKKLGDTVSCDIFSEDEVVSLVGISKGKGFQGVVKRHGFSGVGEASHGQHDRGRSPGSIGASSYPSRVFKGMRMAGRMGGEATKVKGLKILKIYPDKNYILVKGCIPGHNNSIVYIQSK